MLTFEQLVQLWAELDQLYRLVTQIAYFTAARCGEAVSLEWRDLRGNEIIYRATKRPTKTELSSAICRVA